VYFIHGGGTVLSDRFTTMVWCFDWVKQLDVVLLSAEFTKALENTAQRLQDAWQVPSGEPNIILKLALIQKRSL
jgi:hypothetical protein